MSHELREALGWVTIALLIGSLVFFAPWRARRTIVTSRTIRATPDVIWAEIRKISHETCSFDINEAQPDVTVITSKVGWPVSRVAVAKLRTLRFQPPNLLVQRFDEIDGAVFPFGNDGILSEELCPIPSGTNVILGFDGEMTHSWEAWNMRRSQRRLLAKLARTLG